MNKTEKQAVSLEFGDNTAPVLTAKGEAELAEIIKEANRRLYCRRSKIISCLSSFKY